MIELSKVMNHIAPYVPIALLGIGLIGAGIRAIGKRIEERNPFRDFEEGSRLRCINNKGLCEDDGSYLGRGEIVTCVSNDYVFSSNREPLVYCRKKDGRHNYWQRARFEPVRRGEIGE